jgi:hypothetical protein
MGQFGDDAIKSLGQVAVSMLTKYGYQDARAKSAVKTWQQMHGKGIKADGVYGPASAAALASDMAPMAVPPAYVLGGPVDPIRRPTRAVAIATMAKGLRQAAQEEGKALPDTLTQLMIGQMLGAEGAMPGIPGTLGGINNIGAAQVPGGTVGQAFALAKKAAMGWGAFAHRDSNPPPKGAYIGWYYIAPSVLEAARHWLTGYAGTKNVLAQQPTTPEDYARIMYNSHYFTGTSNDSEAMIAQYANNIRRGMPSVEALNGVANDPSAISVDPTQFADVDARKLTEGLFEQAMSGGDGGAWKYLLPGAWTDLVASNGVVWFGPAPAIVAGMIDAAMRVQARIPWWKKVLGALGIGLMASGVYFGTKGK